tara:strand:- start:912 stop:1412 length:501 start_codon:yes stop_codon:yes gene_type:complete
MDNNNNLSINNISNNNLSNNNENKDRNYDLEWSLTLNSYNDNYIAYLTKKVKDRIEDENLRILVIEDNEKLKELINELKMENDKILNNIKEADTKIMMDVDLCNEIKNSYQNKTDEKLEDKITFNKKIKNIEEKKIATQKLLNMLYYVSIFIFVINILLLYFNIKS